MGKDRVQRGFMTLFHMYWYQYSVPLSSQMSRARLWSTAEAEQLIQTVAEPGLEHVQLGRCHGHALGPIVGDSPGSGRAWADGPQRAKARQATGEAVRTPKAQVCGSARHTARVAAVFSGRTDRLYARARCVAWDKNTGVRALPAAPAWQRRV
jgi:hypothetical protein